MSKLHAFWAFALIAIVLIFGTSSFAGSTQSESRLRSIIFCLQVMSGLEDSYYNFNPYNSPNDRKIYENIENNDSKLTLVRAIPEFDRYKILARSSSKNKCGLPLYMLKKSSSCPSRITSTSDVDDLFKCSAGGLTELDADETRFGKAKDDTPYVSVANAKHSSPCGRVSNKDTYSVTLWTGNSSKRTDANGGWTVQELFSVNCNEGTEPSQIADRGKLCKFGDKAGYTAGDDGAVPIQMRPIRNPEINDQLEKGLRAQFKALKSPISKLMEGFQKKPYAAALSKCSEFMSDKQNAEIASLSSPTIQVPPEPSKAAQ